MSLANRFIGYPALHKLNHGGKGASDEVMDFVLAMYDPKQTVYVGWGDSNSTRFGSVGIAVPHGYDHFDRDNWPALPDFATLSKSYYYYRSYSPYYYGLREFSIVFDKKRKVNSVYPSYTTFYWMKGYTGGVVWEWTKKTPPAPKTIVDRLGNELKQGDFIAYVGREKYTTGMGDLFFGFIDKTTNGGTIFAKNIKLSEDDKVLEHRITTPDRVTKLDKTILTTLMLKRLTF